MYRISVPYAQKDPRFLFEKRRGQPGEFWSLVSTIDGSTLPQDCVKICHAEHKETGKTYPKKKKKNDKNYQKLQNCINQSGIKPIYYRRVVMGPFVCRFADGPFLGDI